MLGGMLVASGIAVMLLVLFQRNLVFPRDPSPVATAAAGIAGLEQVALTTSDGERLVAWHVPPRENRPVLVYFHGNAGNLGRPVRLARFRQIVGAGYGLLAVSYRGYGGSTGTPSEAGLHLDARAAYAEAARRYGENRLVAYGESLGTGVAVRLAVQNHVEAVVLEAPYASTAAVAERLYPVLPVRWLMLDQFLSDEIIDRVRAPILILHGTADGVIPIEQGEQLYALSPTPKRLAIFPGGRHEDLYTRGALAVVDRFLREVEAGTLQGAAEERVAPAR